MINWSIVNILVFFSSVPYLLFCKSGRETQTGVEEDVMLPSWLHGCFVFVLLAVCSLVL